MKIPEILSRSRTVGIVMITSAMLCAAAISGCFNPAGAAVTEGASFEKYKQIYLVPPEEDKRNITPQVVSRLEAMNFKVYVVDPNKPSDAQGSGFVITDKGHILTVAHLFVKEDAATVWIKGKRFDADVIKKDEKKDLALLKIRNNEVEAVMPVELAFDANVKMGQDVYTIGFPLSMMLGNAPRLNKGLISSMYGLKDDPNTMQISAEIQSGNSGSPLLNTDGKAIGVVYQTLDPMSVLMRTGGNLPQNVNFAIKMSVVKEFLDTCSLPKEDYPVNTPSRSIDEVQASMVKVHSGKVTDEELAQPKIICHFNYVSIWDLGYRFRIFDIIFLDSETQKGLLRAGQYREDPFADEATTLDNIFKRIHEKVFPLQKN